ncbi:MAG: hypothetical protein ACRD4M_15030 [Candidatus Acidiferrales bacterium]
MQQHGVQHLTTATTGTLAAAPGAGHRITVLGLHISAGGAAIVTVGFSATNQRVYDLVANQTIDLGAMRWEGDANAALTVQSSAAVVVDAEVDYTVEVSPS